MAWTEEQKAKVIEMYQAENPTPDTSTEIIKNIADKLDQSPNGVRMILVQANVYVRKDQSAPAAKKTSDAKSTGTGRVSKDAAIASLKEAISKLGKPVEDEILDKLTGKAAVYLTSLLSE